MLAAVPGWTAGAASVMLLAEMLLTGAIHTDGLGDAADSLGAGRDRGRALAIMKDPRQGSFGVVAIALSLLFRWVAYARLLEGADGWGLVIGAFAVSRAGTAQLAAFQPYARAEEGTGRPFVGEGRILPVAAGWLITAGIAVFIAKWAGLVALGLGTGFAWAFGCWCRGRYGGVTGDLLGAHTEISLVLALFLLAVLHR